MEELELSTELLNEILHEALATLRATKQNLDTVGHRHPHFDLITNVWQELQKNTLHLAKWQEKQTKRKGKKIEREEILQTTAKALHKAWARIESAPLGTEFQTLRDTLGNLAMVAAALSAGEQQIAFLLGMHMATIGIETKTSALGIVGEGISSAAEQLAGALRDELLPEATPGAIRLLPRLIATGLAASIVLAFLTCGKEKANDVHSRFFFELSLLLAVTSGSMEIIARSMAAACGFEEKKQEVVAAALSSLAVLVMINVASGGEKEKKRSALQSVQPNLVRWLSRLESLKGSEKAESPLRVMLHQGRAALEYGQYDLFIDLQEQAEDLLVGGKKGLQKAIAEGWQLAQGMQSAFGEGALGVAPSHTEIAHV